MEGGFRLKAPVKAALFCFRGICQGVWVGGHHRKWAAILDREQFDAFVLHCDLEAEDIETMGSIGAPGYGYGLAPAISFTSHDPDAIQSAYVTPMPEIKRESCGERDWQRIRASVLAVYA